MKYEIEATELQIEKFHKGLKLGLDVSGSLIYAAIDKYTFAKWVINKNILQEYKYINNNNNEIEEALGNYSVKQVESGGSNAPTHTHKKELALMKKDKEYRSYINKTAQIIFDIEQDKIWLEAKLLNDIHKAPEMKSSNYAASSWLLERLFKDKYQKDSKEVNNIKEVKPINVEFVDAKTEEERVKQMIDLVDKEINGESKA